jgi:hypothetical protein
VTGPLPTPRNRDKRHRHRDLWVPLVAGLLTVIAGSLAAAAVTRGLWSLVLIIVCLLTFAFATYIVLALVWGLPLPGGFEPPPSRHSPPTTGRLTDLIYGPEAQQRRQRQWERQLDAIEAEDARRQRIINALYREYIDTHADSLEPAMRAATADLPKRWVETRLVEMGEDPIRWGWERYRPDL